jgi:transcriptional regulator GlxA family with amidase domain
MERTKEKKSGVLRRAFGFIKENYDKDISLENISASSGRSRYDLCRIFQRHTNISPMRFLWQFRVTLAASLIQTTDSRFKEIATSTGFKSTAHFSSNFKKQYGLTPSEYRRLNRPRETKDISEGFIGKPEESLLISSFINVLDGHKSELDDLGLVKNSH